MKLAVSVTNRPEENGNFTHYGLNSIHSKYTELDVPVSPEFEMATEMLRPLWSRNTDYPRVVMNSGGHGDELGIVYKDSVTDRRKGKIRFTRSEVATRVSAGGVRDGDRISFHETPRLHIGIYAGRKIFPEDWERLFPEGTDYHRKGVSPFVPVRELVHLSMRWVDGKYDDWDDPGLWLRGYPNKNWNENRANYMSATTERLGFPNTPCEWVDRKTGMRVVREEGRVSRAIPFDTPFSDFEGRSKVVEELLGDVFGYSKGLGGSIPTIGLVPMETKLYKRIPSFESNVRRMGMEEGTEYLFGRVLPEVLEFTGGRGFSEIAEELRATNGA